MISRLLIDKGFGFIKRRRTGVLHTQCDAGICGHIERARTILPSITRLCPIAQTVVAGSAIFPAAALIPEFAGQSPFVRREGAVARAKTEIRMDIMKKAVVESPSSTAPSIKAYPQPEYEAQHGRGNLMRVSRSPRRESAPRALRVPTAVGPFWSVGWVGAHSTRELERRQVPSC